MSSYKSQRSQNSQRSEKEGPGNVFSHHLLYIISLKEKTQIWVAVVWFKCTGSKQIDWFNPKIGCLASQYNNQLANTRATKSNPVLKTPVLKMCWSH